MGLLTARKVKERRVLQNLLGKATQQGSRVRREAKETKLSTSVILRGMLGQSSCKMQTNMNGFYCCLPCRILQTPDHDLIKEETPKIHKYQWYAKYTVEDQCNECCEHKCNQWVRSCAKQANYAQARLFLALEPNSTFSQSCSQSHMLYMLYYAKIFLSPLGIYGSYDCYVLQKRQGSNHSSLWLLTFRRSPNPIAGCQGQQFLTQQLYKMDLDHAQKHATFSNYWRSSSISSSRRRRSERCSIITRSCQEKSWDHSFEYSGIRVGFTFCFFLYPWRNPVWTGAAVWPIASLKSMVSFKPVCVELIISYSWTISRSFMALAQRPPATALVKTSAFWSSDLTSARLTSSLFSSSAKDDRLIFWVLFKYLSFFE